MKMTSWARIWVLLCLTILTTLFVGCADSDEIVTYPYDPGEFITNVRGSNAFLKSNITIEVTDPTHVDKLTEKNYIIRSVISEYLSRKDDAALDADDAVSVLTEDIRVKVNEALGVEYCYRVWLTFART